MRQWWGMKRLGHTLSSKTQLVANDTTLSARGPEATTANQRTQWTKLWPQWQCISELNTDTHTHVCIHKRTHRFCSSETQIYCMIRLKTSKALCKICALLGRWWANNMLSLSRVIRWSHPLRTAVHRLPRGRAVPPVGNPSDALEYNLWCFRPAM